MQRRKELTLIFTWVTVVGIALILVVIFFFFRKDRWKTYENRSAGFRISYPADWSVSENQFGALVIFSSPQENDLDKFRENVNIVIQDLSAHPMTLDKYTELAIRQVKLVFKKNVEGLESTEAYLDDMPGHKFVYLGKGDVEVKYMHIWGMGGVKVYQVTYTAAASGYDRFISKAERMIKSFKRL